MCIRDRKSITSFNGGPTSGQNEGAEEQDEDEDEDEDEDPLSSRTQDTQKFQTPVDVILQKTSLLKHKMFQFHPVKIKRDDYGTIFDFNMLIPKDQEEIEETSKSKRRAIIHSDSAHDEDSYDPAKQINKKRKGTPELEMNNFDNLSYLDTSNTVKSRSETNEQLILRCMITYINLESLVDQRSASVIWPSLRARKLIIQGPEEVQDEKLINMLRKKGTDTLVLPLGEDVEFTTTIKTLEISLDPDLDSLLKWQKISDRYTVAHVTGHLVNEKSLVNGQPTSKSKLVLKPMDNITKIHASGTLSVGDVRLVELKRKLTEIHHVAEFKGEGMLVIDDKVAVMKVSDGETIIDGSPSELFDLVKKMVTDMLAQV